MPTGYTDRVGKGELDDFSQFALACSRAMGVAIMQRDEDGRAPLRIERKPDTHYRDTAEKYSATVRQLETATDVELTRMQLREVAEENAMRAEALRKATVVAERYQVMLAQVEAWTPPTPEHEGIKLFMREQLVESIKFDGPSDWERETAQVVPVEEYRAKKLASARRMRDSYEKYWREEQERVASRAAWIEAFLASLPDPDAHAKAVAAYNEAARS